MTVFFRNTQGQLRKAFNPDQPRDANGRWGAGGSSSTEKPKTGLEGVKQGPKVEQALSDAGYTKDSAHYDPGEGGGGPFERGETNTVSYKNPAGDEVRVQYRLGGPSHGKVTAWSHHSADSEKIGPWAHNGDLGNGPNITTLQNHLRNGWWQVKPVA
jgi:hypothetical protein